MWNLSGFSQFFELDLEMKEEPGMRLSPKAMSLFIALVWKLSSMYMGQMVYKWIFKVKVYFPLFLGTKPWRA